jgi:Tol biopolymer transport system component
VVLYEMIAGCAPFRGATHADVIVALLEREPEPLAGNRAQLDEIVATALAKNCDRRYQTATELLRALESCPEEPASHERQTKQQLRTSTQNVPPNARAVRVKRGRRIAIWLLGGIGGIALAWLLYRSNQKPAVWAERSQRHISQFISKKVGAGGALSRPAFSPDGKQIAYSLSEEGGSHLWVKALATQAETRITDGPWLDSDPVWSPDGQKIAFFSNRDGRRDLWVVALAPQPGHPALLKKLDLFAENLITWKKNQQSDLLYLEANGDLFALNPVSTQLSRLTKLDSAHPGTDFSLSPKQDKVAYRDTVNAEYRLLIKPLPNGEATVLLKGSEPIRSPVWFEDGEKIAFCANRTGSYQVYALWLDDRRIEQITFNNDNYSALALSPDGNTMAINATTENANVFASDVHDRTEVQHFSARGLQVLPALSLDEKMMIFQAAGSNEQGAETIFLKPAIPADAAQRLTRGFNGRWSPNGEAVAFLRDSSAKTELWCVNLRDKAEQRLASGIAYASYSPMPFYLAYAEYDWSPDGTKITYSSKKSGQSNLWQVSADAAQDTRLTYNNDNQITLYSPRWAADGSKLAYLSGARAIGEKRPSIQSINLLESGKSSILFQREAALRILGWAANGQELLIASGQRQGIAINNQIELLSINVSNRALRALSTLKDAYLPSLTLSGDGRSLALVSRRNGRDNVEVISLVNGSARQITNNLDPTTYYAALSWDTAGRRLFYSKQEKWENSFLIEKRK